MLSLKAKVLGEDPRLIESLKEIGFSSKMVRGAVIVDLRHVGTDRTHYKVPDLLTDYQLFVEVSENGSGATNTGYATIVCGLKGQPLKPYRLDHKCGGDHAQFALYDSFVTVYGSRRRDDYEIVIKQYQFEPENKLTIENKKVIVERFARLKEEQLWKGVLEELPVLFGQFEDAANAALIKTNCYHCKEAHFIQKTEKSKEVLV